MNSGFLDIGVNFRPIGGIPKRLHIFRSGSFDILTFDEIKFLQKNWNIYHFIDLRTHGESSGDQSIRTASANWLNSFPLGDFTAEFRKKLFPSPSDYATYYFCLLQMNQDNIRRLFLYLTDKLQFSNFVIGCSAGKDRTGVISYLIQMLAGVGLEKIVEDYCLSSEYINRKLQFFASHWEKRGLTPDQYRIRIEARAENILLFHSMFQEHYKSIDQYFMQIGIPQSQINKMKEQLSGGE